MNLDISKERVHRTFHLPLLPYVIYEVLGKVLTALTAVCVSYGKAEPLSTVDQHASMLAKERECKGVSQTQFSSFRTAGLDEQRTAGIRE